MSDTNWQSYYGDNPDTSGFVNPPNPQDYDDIMKFSDCTNAVINGRYVVAGRENCVDAVRGANYEWRACSLASGAGVSAVTIKGAIDGWRFIGCTIGRGKQTDIELGQFDNYWTPGRKPTRNGLIKACVSEDGSPIRVTCWNADKPEVVGSNVKIRPNPVDHLVPLLLLAVFDDAQRLICSAFSHQH
jgi:hypothetical protein